MLPIYYLFCYGLIHDTTRMRRRSTCRSTYSGEKHPPPTPPLQCLFTGLDCDCQCHLLMSDIYFVEHTKTERQVLESIRNCPFLVKLHYAFQTDAKLHLILGLYMISDMPQSCVLIWEVMSGYTMLVGTYQRQVKRLSCHKRQVGLCVVVSNTNILIKIT